MVLKCNTCVVRKHDLISIDATELFWVNGINILLLINDIFCLLMSWFENRIAMLQFLAAIFIPPAFLGVFRGNVMFIHSRYRPKILYI